MTSKIYVLDKYGRFVPVDADSEFPTKQPEFTFWEKDLAWKVDDAKGFLVKIWKKLGEYVS